MLTLKHKHILTIALVGTTLATVSLPFAVVADVQTTSTAINLSVNPVITSFSSGPTVTLGAITPDTTGKQSAASDTISASTNDAAGLTITLASSSAATTMVSGANTILASAGTPAAPIALVNNTWGWRIDSLGGFGAGPGALISNAVPSAITYAAIAATGSPFTIKTTAVSGATSSTVWFSSRINNTQPNGAYVATVTYTITTN